MHVLVCQTEEESVHRDRQHKKRKKKKSIENKRAAYGTNKNKKSKKSKDSGCPWDHIPSVWPPSSTPQGSAEEIGLTLVLRLSANLEKKKLVLKMHPATEKRKKKRKKGNTHTETAFTSPEGFPVGASRRHTNNKKRRVIIPMRLLTKRKQKTHQSWHWRDVPGIETKAWKEEHKNRTQEDRRRSLVFKSLAEFFLDPLRRK